MVLEDPDDPTSCTDPAKCPSEDDDEHDGEDSGEKCPPGKVYDKCHRSCFATCDSPQEPAFCLLGCAEGKDRVFTTRSFLN